MQNLDKYKIVVSEPWDFEGAEKPNLITGTIVEILTPNCLIFKSDHILKFENIEGYFLLLKTRYEGDDLNNLKGTVGGGLILINDYKNYDEKYIEKHSKYVIVGALDKL